MKNSDRILQDSKTLILLTGISLLAVIYWLCLPERLFNTPCSKVLLDNNNELIAARIAADGQWRFPQSDSVPQKFRQCILAFEDDYFYYHPGFNPVSILKSVKQNISTGRIKRGGSTITMQLARMIQHNRSRSYYHKLSELALAIRIECTYSKSSILNLYCSNAPFGSNVVGLSAAAWRYFGRGPEKLSWAESAMLAVLPNAPALIYPGKNQQRLLEKRDRLLKKLLNKNKIDEATYRLAIREPLPQKPFPIPQLAPHLLDRSIAEHPADNRFNSTLRKSLQVQVTQLLDKHIQNLSANDINNACAVVADTETGDILAYVGNSSSQTNAHENYVDIINSPRSTGSILKPFLYAFMLSENKILPECLLEDIPTQIGSYSPKNFSLTYDGLVPANQAIARSLNVPAVKMLQEYGTARFHQRLKQLGFKTFSKPAEHYGLSLILGGGEATLWDLASAYSSMARALLGYSDLLHKYKPNCYRPLNYLRTAPVNTEQRHTSDLLGAAAIYYTFTAMTELLRPQDYVGWMRFLSKSRIAWKTGTSFGFRDAWAVGVNPKYTVAVWVGNADGEGRPDLTGTRAAAPLMFSIFNSLLQKKWFNAPVSDFEMVRACAQSGYKASEICDSVVFKYYPKGASKTKACSFHKLIHLDQSGRYRVNSNCYPVSNMQHRAWFVATPTQEYFFRQHNVFYKPLPDYLPGCASEAAYRQMDLIYPRDGFKIYVPVDQSGQRSRCVFKATHKQTGATLYWYLDGAYIGATQKFHQLSVLPPKGLHALEITDSFGETVTCKFEVIEK